MNKRKLPCGKDYIAVGVEDSIADYRERIAACKECRTLCYKGIILIREIGERLN